MPAPITITKHGYVYIYLSNENPTPVEVFFDELKVTHTKSPVIQTDDYYPFGLAFNSYQSENTTINQYLYNGKEKQVTSYQVEQFAPHKPPKQPQASRHSLQIMNKVRGVHK